jgi:glycerol-3-phosphate acyltransferase PlsY
MNKLSAINKKEFLRKLIHLSSLWIIIAATWLPAQQFKLILFLTTSIVLIIDISRRYIAPLNKLFNKVFCLVLRNNEFKNNSLTGASYMLISACICYLIYPQITFILAMSVLIISDTAAALIGINYGKYKIFGKTIEGLIAFIITGFMICFTIFKYYHLSLMWLSLATISVVIGAIAEFLSNKIKLDDNFIIPISIATSYQIFNFLL